MATESTTATIRIKNLSKTFVLRHNQSRSLKSKIIGLALTRYRERKENFQVLHNINLDVEPGTCMGLVGTNGSGKSTLLRLIAGIFPPTEGQIQVPAKARIGTMIALGVGFSAELSGAENIYLNASLYGFQRHEVEAQYDKIVEFSGLGDFIDTPVKNYSSGMHARLGFAIIAHMPMDIMLVDEVLAVGDANFSKKCLQRMNELKAEGRTIVFVSHSVPDVLRFCDMACLIHKSEVLGTYKPEFVLHYYNGLLEATMTPEYVREQLAGHVARQDAHLETDASPPKTKEPN